MSDVYLLNWANISQDFESFTNTFSKDNSQGLVGQIVGINNGLPVEVEDLNKTFERLPHAYIVKASKLKL